MSFMPKLIAAAAVAMLCLPRPASLNPSIELTVL
jgi:hypothetical protein